MEFDWGYFFSLFSVGAFWQACVTVVVVSSLSWFIGLILGFLLLAGILIERLPRFRQLDAPR